MDLSAKPVATEDTEITELIKEKRSHLCDRFIVNSVFRVFSG